MQQPQDDRDEILENLDQHVTRLGLMLRWYRQMFCDKDAREVLLEDAPAFFEDLSGILAAQIILGITKIVHDGDKRALTIQGLLGRPDVSKNAVQVQDLITQLEKDVEPLRRHRDKRIAHNERIAKAKTLTPISIECIDGIINTLKKLLNLIYDETSDSFVDFDNTVCNGNAEDVVLAFKRSRQLRELEKLAWKEKEWSMVHAILWGEAPYPVTLPQNPD